MSIGAMTERRRNGDWKNSLEQKYIISVEETFMNSYQDANAAVIDRWVTEGWEWGKPIDHQTYLQAQNGQWSVLLTPTKPAPHEWFGSLKGKKVLGLASGGRSANAYFYRSRGGMHYSGLFGKTA